MKLKDYLADRELAPGEFADLIEVSSEAVRLYTLGQRIPRPAVMAAIATATNGAVTANDFFHEAA